MEISIKPLKYYEQEYTYRQSSQIGGQTGNKLLLTGEISSGQINVKRDVLSPGAETVSAEELSEILRFMETDEKGLLSSRDAMAAFAKEYPDNKIKRENPDSGSITEYGFRMDTEKHTYLFRCNPEQKFYCLCYDKNLLDKHIEKAQRGIRFIDSQYNELFRIPDGKQIIVTDAVGEKHDFVCRYIDNYHAEVGRNLFHICEFAERMERIGGAYSPKETPLPYRCYAVNKRKGEIMSITRYEHGYKCKPNLRQLKTNKEREAYAMELNGYLDEAITPAQVSAMKAGCLFGWGSPLAKAEAYDKNGKAINAQRGHGDTR